MPSAVTAIIVGTVVVVVGILGYAYKQGIKVSTNVCQEEKLKQQLANKEAEVKNKDDLIKNNQLLLDEANRQLESEQKQTTKLQETIDALRIKPDNADSSYQCVPDSVLEDLRKLRLLRGAIR